MDLPFRPLAAGPGRGRVREEELGGVEGHGQPDFACRQVVEVGCCDAVVGALRACGGGNREVEGCGVYWEFGDEDTYVGGCVSLGPERGYGESGSGRTEGVVSH